MSICAILAVLLFSLASPVYADSPPAASQSDDSPESAEEIQRCVRRNLPRGSSVQTLIFRSTDRIGSVTSSESTLHWKLFDDGLSKARLSFEAPIDLRGASVLLIENKGRRPDTFMYIPELRSTRRVSSRAASSSLFGTDFSYMDFERLLGMSADARKERLPDAEIEGRPVFVVAGFPDPQSGSAYERVIVFVDRATCVPLRTESYEKGGRLRKRLETKVKSITQESDRWIPRSQTMRDLRDETTTELLVEDIEIDVDIHRKTFSVGGLASGAH